jgi:hypothetical protein
MTTSQNNVTGSWLGNYYYSSVSSATGFEAVFAQSGTAIEGSILDDGALGEAHLTGSCASGELTFCKIYNSKARDPVYYRGVLSEDGKSITGTWRINAQVNGAWKAWRQDDEQLPETMERDDEVEHETEKERELVPLTAPAKTR